MRTLTVIVYLNMPAFHRSVNTHQRTSQVKRRGFSSEQRQMRTGHYLDFDLDDSFVLRSSPAEKALMSVVWPTTDLKTARCSYVSVVQVHRVLKRAAFPVDE